KEGKLQDAERLYRAILESQPAHPDANHNLGLLAVAVNQVEAALPLFKTALDANPKIEQFWFSYIDALLKEKQFGNAKQVIERAKTQVADGERLNKLEAQLVSKNEESNASRAGPTEQQLGNLLAYYQAGRLAEAEELAISLTQEFPTHQFAWKVLGAVLGQTGRKPEAVDATQKAIALFPQDAELHSNLGKILKELGRLDEAEASYRKAIALEPDYAETHSSLGNTLKELGRLDEAEASYRKAIALEPDYAQTCYNLGVTLKELGRLEEAEEAYTQAIASKRDYDEAHNNLGNTLKELGRLEEAEASLGKAIALNPNYAEAYGNLGVTLHELGKLDEAEATYKRAIELKPDFAEAHGNLGATLQELGRLGEVEDLCRQILSTKSTSVSPETNTPITCLLCHGRSGTMFVHSLFDGHPGLATLPGVYFKGWFALNSWQRFEPCLVKPNWRENIVHAFLKEYEPLFNANSKNNVLGEPFGQSAWLAKDSGFTTMGPEYNQVFVLDEVAFSRTLISLLQPFQTVTNASFFELVHRAFEIAIRGRSNLRDESVGHIFYHMHNPSILEEANFLRHYPEARLLRLTRNPIQSLESWLNFGETLSNWHDLVTKILTMFFSMQINHAEDPRYRGIKLEDIKRSPSRVIPQIAAWMGIEDHPSLYESNFCGIEYWGPAAIPTTGAITGFDTKAIDQPIGRFFGPREIVIFETLFWPFLGLYGYTDMDSNEFRNNLSRIRNWLQEPLEFETKLYNALPDHPSKIQAMGPYKRLHRFLNQLWSTLDKDETYRAMIQPLKVY
ncbi:MAG: tetratricopeptide repeat protein, partial [Candidatus Azotimanducaceae bacterium]